MSIETHLELTMTLNIFLLTFALLTATNVFPAKLPAPAPDFEGHTMAGKTLSLSELKGQVVLLDFWASWCKPCQKEFPFLVKLSKQYRKKGLRVVAVNLDEDAAKMKKFLGRLHLLIPFPVVSDPKGKIARLYKVDRMPTTALIGRDGKMHFRHGGFKDSFKKEYLAEINSLLQEEQNHK